MKKKTLTLLLCGAFAAVCLLPAACAPAQEDETRAPAKLNWLQTVNSYEDDKVMLIGAHGEPEPTEEAYRTAAEMGLTFTFVIENVDDLHVYDLAQKAGMKTIPSMNNTFASFRGVDWSVGWSDIPSVIAVDYFDEPLEAHFDVISGWVDIHNEKYAESGGEQPLFWVNMLPLDASLQIAPQTDEEFIAQYCEEILSKIKGKPVLSYDYYPLRTMWNKLEKAYDYVAVEWLRTMELNAKYAALYGADTHAYIQTCGFYSPSPDHSTWTCRISDEAALRFQVYTSMAFGIRNFTHFTYKSSDLVGTDYGYTPACSARRGRNTRCTTTRRPSTASCLPSTTYSSRSAIRGQNASSARKTKREAMPLSICSNTGWKRSPGCVPFPLRAIRSSAHSRTRKAATAMCSATIRIPSPSFRIR